MKLKRIPVIKAPIFVALPLALVLMAALFAALYNDARHGVADYRGAVATALPAHR